MCVLSVIKDHQFALCGYLQDDETPLHCAAARNNVECLQLLVARGADVNVADKVQTSSHRFMHSVLYINQIVNHLKHKSRRALIRRRCSYQAQHCSVILVRTMCFLH